MKQWMMLVMCFGMALAAPAVAQAPFGAGLAGGLTAGDDDFERGVVLGRLIDGRDDGRFAGGFVLGRFLSPAERNLRARALRLARQRRLERELALERELDLERELALDRAFARERALLLRRRAARDCLR